MSVINQEVFASILQDNTHPKFRDLSGNIRGATNNLVAVPPNGVDREAAILLLQQIVDYVRPVGWYASKYLRPYTYDDFSYLDRSEPWWGFEFETGYSSSDARAAAITVAAEVAENGVTFDCEGEGEHFSEITFSPAEQSKYLDGTAPAYKFVEWLNDNPTFTNCTGNVHIGTHLNLSCPQASESFYRNAARVLNNSIHLLPTKTPEGNYTRELMFGRNDIYGGCHVPDGGWIEMKLFRTTYSLDVFENYMKTARALTKIVQAYKELDAPNAYSRGVSNLYEMWLDPSVEPVFIHDTSLLGEYEGWYISDPNADSDSSYREEYYDDDYDDGDNY